MSRGLHTPYVGAWDTYERKVSIQKWREAKGAEKERVAARPVQSSPGRVPETELGFYDTMWYWGHFNCACCTKYSLPNVSTDSSLLPFHPAGS